MKRIYFELIMALVVLAWLISNILIVPQKQAVYVFMPVIFGFMVQFVGTLIVAATQPIDEGN